MNEVIIKWDDENKKWAVVGYNENCQGWFDLFYEAETYKEALDYIAENELKYIK